MTVLHLSRRKFKRVAEPRRNIQARNDCQISKWFPTDSDRCFIYRIKIEHFVFVWAKEEKENTESLTLLPPHDKQSEIEQKVGKVIFDRLHYE